MTAEELFTGQSLERWLPAGQEDLPKKSAAFPFMSASCLCQKCLCDTATLRELRVLERRERALFRKKGGRGDLQWLVNLEKLFSHFWLLHY